MQGITVGIPTKNRYECLDKTLLSIAFQTLKPLEVIIVDDSDKIVDIREIPHYEYILRLFDDKGIKWRVIFGQKKGQHYSHQTVQEEAEGDLIFRIDDDEVAEPTVLESLSKVFENFENVGAVAPSVTMPNPRGMFAGPHNRIDNIEASNLQWFVGKGVHPVEHLYSCFLYKKGIIKYDLSLSTVAHREETIFSHSIYRAGYSLYVDMYARVHHFRAGGGIRTFQDPGLWEHDEKIFQGYLDRWGVKQDKKKMVVLDSGIGDHWAFKHILKDLKEKYPNLVIACCYPEVFEDEGVKLISIAEAKLMYGNIDNFNIYKFMGDHNWSSSLVEAFKALYLDEHTNIPIFKTNEKREGEPQKLSLLGKGYKLVN